MPKAGAERRHQDARPPSIDFLFFDTIAVPQPNAGTVLAFDFGDKRIGIAVGEERVAIAHPLTTIAGDRSQVRFDAIGALIAEWQPSRLVVGLPLHMDDANDREHPLAARVRRFARQLEGRFHLPVTLIDERLTTREAAGLLHDAGLDARRQKPVRDQVAAQRILRSYFDHRDGNGDVDGNG